MMQQSTADSRFSLVNIAGHSSQGSKAEGNVAKESKTDLLGDFRPNGINGSLNAATNTGKGGGGLASIDDHFQVNPCTGTMSLSIPVVVSPARGGFEPNLYLSYNSGSGNGPHGIGWSLDLPSASILRKTSKQIPTYDDEVDVFVISGNEEDLVLIEDQPKEPNTDFIIQVYTPEVGNNSIRVEKWSSRKDSTDVHWRSISNDNITTIFGLLDSSRLFNWEASGGKKIFSWLACYSYDGKGNAIRYDYKAEDSANLFFTGEDAVTFEDCRTDSLRSRARYLKSIKYGNRHPNRDPGSWDVLPADGLTWLFEVVLDYGEHAEVNPTTTAVREWSVRKDPFSVYNGGFEIRYYRLCRRILLFHHIREILEREDCLLRSTDFIYNESGGGSFLTKLTVQGFQPLGFEDYSIQELPSLSFEYSKIEEDCLIGVCPKVLANESLAAIPGSLTMNTEWLDLDGEGTPGIIFTAQKGATFYQRNELAGSLEGDSATQYDSFQSLVNLQTQPSFDDIRFGHYYDDVEGRGSMSLISLNREGQPHGYFRRSEGKSWHDFRQFDLCSSVDAKGNRAARIDLTGNGLNDILIQESIEELVWYQNLGTKGFDSPRRVLCPVGMPGLGYQDDNSQVFYADMSGGGLTDIVHIRNGIVSYWPNLGYGRFGNLVSMSNSPIFAIKDDFSTSRIRLLDIDGSGTTDILYLPSDGGVRIYLNLAGNSWSGAYVNPNFPRLDNLSSVTSVDLFGKGTAVLCWVGAKGVGNSRLQYLDFAGATKPNLLTRYSNGRGIKTDIKYRPSTWFYIHAERSGDPWSTKLPFPVQCVWKTIAEDEVVKTAQVTKYFYHDGYYDNIKREFCGFGRVNRFVQEDFAKRCQYRYTRPVIRTVTWYHTGRIQGATTAGTFAPTFLEGTKINVPFQRDSTLYFPAHRALKGTLLRQEIYSEDGSSKSHLPYLTEEYTYEVKLSDKRALKIGTVLSTQQREKISIRYDREDISDPHVEHELFLERNTYGQPTKSAKIAYGRTKSDVRLSEEDTKRQAETIVEYTETDYTNDVSIIAHDIFRKPLVAGVRVYKVIGLEFKDRTVGFTELTDIRISELPSVDFQTPETLSPVEKGAKVFIPPQKIQYKVLIKETVSFYRSNDLLRRLSLSEVQSYSTLDQEYELAYTSDLLQKVSESIVSPGSGGNYLDNLKVDGGYTDVFQDGRWWISSIRERFSLDPSKELEAARAAYYLPQVTLDAFGNTSITKHDPFNLLIAEATDALGNVIKNMNNYIHLQPDQVIDINGNRTDFAFDAFGVIVGMARLGRNDNQSHESLNGFEAILTEKSITEFLKNPIKRSRELLGNAERRKVIGRLQFQDHKDIPDSVKACFEAEIVAETSTEMNEARQISIQLTYFDGHGREIQQICLESTKGEGEEKWWKTMSKILDAEGQMVRTFERSFEPNHRFISQDAERPISSFTIYDPANRKIGHVYPNRTWAKTKYNPWGSEEFNVGDTILTSDMAQDDDIGAHFKQISVLKSADSWSAEREKSPDPWQNSAAKLSAIYFQSPTVHFTNSFGQDIVTIADFNSANIHTREYYDLSGNLSATVDDGKRKVQTATHDHLHRKLQLCGMDSGTEWVFPSCDGQPLAKWNSRKFTTQYSYDKLRRPVAICLYRGVGTDKILTTRMSYGESFPIGTGENIRGQLHKVEDQSGITVYGAYDLRGNCTTSSMQFAREYKNIIDWESQVSLDANIYEQSSVFNNHSSIIISIDSNKNIVRFTYNPGGNLKSVERKEKDQNPWTQHKFNIEYNADGRAVSENYGNGGTCRNRYDDYTGRLLQKTLKSKSGKLIKDKLFYYDCEDRQVYRIQRGIDIGRDRSDSPAITEYKYNSIGQLIQTKSREQIGLNPSAPYSMKKEFNARNPSVHGKETCEYIETYEYDRANNITKMIHTPLGVPKMTGWTRHYIYDGPSFINGRELGDRLTRTKVGNIEEYYRYDSDSGIRGCPSIAPDVNMMTWDHEDRLKSSSTQILNEGIPGITYYVYDHTGARRRKVTESSAPDSQNVNMIKNHLYLSEMEVYTTFTGSGAIKKESTTYRVACDELICLIEKSDSQILLRYQVGEDIELDDQTNLVSYEEVSSFGATTYRAYGKNITASRQYRLAEYERDPETALDYCNARYYSSWIGRWLSPDPIGIEGGLNLYAYVGNDPINLIDPDGTNPIEPQTVIPEPNQNSNRNRPNDSVLGRPDDSIVGLHESIHIEHGQGQEEGTRQRHIEAANTDDVELDIWEDEKEPPKTTCETIKEHAKAFIQHPITKELAWQSIKAGGLIAVKAIGLELLEGMHVGKGYQDSAGETALSFSGTVTAMTAWNYLDTKYGLTNWFKGKAEVVGNKAMNAGSKIVAGTKSAGRAVARGTKATGRALKRANLRGSHKVHPTFGVRGRRYLVD